MTKREQEALIRKIQRDIFENLSTIEGPMFRVIETQQRRERYVQLAAQPTEENRSERIELLIEGID